MKVQMKNNLIERYEKILPGEFAAQEDRDETFAFLESIEGKEIKVIFVTGDAFEEKDRNIWLPNDLWVAVKGR